MNLVRRHMVNDVRLLLRLLTHWEVSGRENLPQGGPLLVVFNHIAHLDGLVAIASLPWDVEVISLSDLFQVPVTGQLLRWYGAIPVHRDAFDRELLKRALQVLSEGKVLALAPEARMSPSRALEHARDGAAYLALRSAAALLPVGLTGTERMWSELRAGHRPRIGMQIGASFRLQGPLARGAERHAQLESGTDEIMRHIAALLPPSYRGIYS
jgi:1-acyl-sn-glycerol-3-phosphate acyltransferase